MSIWFLLAVIAWGIGAIEPLINNESKLKGLINWLCAGLCLAGIGLWLA